VIFGHTKCYCIYVVTSVIVYSTSLQINQLFTSGCAGSLLLCIGFLWRRKRQPTPVFLPGEPRDGGAWWAAVYGVAQSQTRLKWLSSSSSKAFQRFWERMTHIFSRYPLCLAVSASSEFIKFVGHHVDGISIQVHVKTNLICSYLRLRPVTKITITHLPIYMSLLFAWKTEEKKKKHSNKF